MVQRTNHKTIVWRAPRLKGLQFCVCSLPIPASQEQRRPITATPLSTRDRQTVESHHKKQKDPVGSTVRYEILNSSWLVLSPVRYIDMTYRLSIYRHFWKNIDIDINIDMVIFENIDIDKAILKNIDIDIDKAIPKISISISISIWWFWKISISISISIRRSWKYRYLKRILTIPLSTFMDIVVNCIEWHSMKFIQKIIHFCAQGLPGLSLNYFFYCKQANLQKLKINFKSFTLLQHWY